MISAAFTGAWLNADGAGNLEFVLHPGKLFVSDNGAFRGRVLRVDTVNGAWYLPQTTALVVTADDGLAVSGRLKLVHLFPLEVGYPGALQPVYKLPGQSGDVWWHKTTPAGNFVCDGWESVDPAVANVRQLVNALNAAPYPNIKIDSGAAQTAVTTQYPHTCPRCGKPAYVGFAKVDCSGGCQ